MQPAASCADLHFLTFMEDDEVLQGMNISTCNEVMLHKMPISSKNGHCPMLGNGKHPIFLGPVYKCVRMYAWVAGPEERNPLKKLLAPNQRDGGRKKGGRIKPTTTPTNNEPFTGKNPRPERATSALSHAMATPPVPGNGQLAFLPSFCISRRDSSINIKERGSDSGIPKMGFAKHNLRSNSGGFDCFSKKKLLRFCEIAEKLHRLFLESRKLPRSPLPHTAHSVGAKPTSCRVRHAAPGR